MIVELNGSGARYGFDDAAVHSALLSYGFLPFRYEPFTRVLDRLAAPNSDGNTIYVRDVDFVAARLKSAPARQINGVSL
jgi:hypothetical protein